MIRHAIKSIIFLIALMLPVWLQAQGYRMSVLQSSIQARNLDNINIVVKVVNHSADSLKGNIQCINDPAIDIISKSIIPVNLNPGDSSFVSVSLIVSRKAHAGVHPVRFVLNDKNNRQLAGAESIVDVAVKRDVSLFVYTKNILMDNTIDSLVIPVQVFNAGNTEQTLNILCVYPLALQERSVHNTTRITLRPSADTTVFFARPITRRMIAGNDFDITVTGLYSNGGIVGGAMVHVQSAKSTRDYLDKLGPGSYIDNAVQIGSQNMFTQSETYILRANGGFDIGEKDKINYNLDLTQWKSTNTQTMLRSTWFEYKNRAMGIRAGNLNRSLDINLSGRGALASVNTSRNSSIEAGYLDNNPNLTESKSIGNAGWVNFSQTSKQWGSQHFALFENNLFMNTHNRLAGNTLNFTGKNRFTYTFNINGSSVSEYHNQTDGKYGFALGASMNGKVGKATLNSSNYYSTGHYSGLQKGARIFSERIYWTTSRAASVWGVVEYRSYSPKALSGVQYAMPSFTNARVEWGYTRKLSVVTFTVNPVLTQESSNAYVFENNASQTHDLTSFNVVNIFSVPVNTYDYLSLNAENGVYFSSFDARKRFHSRVSLSYKRNQFNLNARWQQGPFYLGEVANNFRNNRSSGTLVTVSPSLRKSFLRSKLKTETGVSYTYNSNFNSTLMISERLEYQVNSKTVVYAYFNHNRYGTTFNSNQLEMGLIRHLPVPRSEVKRNQLEVFAFVDTNQDGTFNGADSIAANTVININEEIFVTDRQGRITYKNLPDGNVRISAPFSKGNYSPEQTVRMEKKTLVEIPLQTIGTLKGKLKFTRTDLSYEIGLDLFGIPIIAIDKNGKEYRTKTTPDGRYIFYIPVGTYKVIIDSSQFPSEIEVSENGVERKIEAGAVETVDFDIKAKLRKVDVRKFVSPSSLRDKRR